MHGVTLMNVSHRHLKEQRLGFRLPSLLSCSFLNGRSCNSLHDVLSQTCTSVICHRQRKYAEYLRLALVHAEICKLLTDGVYVPTVPEGSRHPLDLDNRHCCDVVLRPNEKEPSTLAWRLPCTSRLNANARGCSNPLRLRPLAHRESASASSPLII